MPPTGIPQTEWDEQSTPWETFCLLWFPSIADNFQYQGLHSQQIMLLMRSALIYFGAVWECIKQCTCNFTLCSSCGGLPFNQHLLRESWTRLRQGTRSCTAILIHSIIIMPFTWCLFCPHLPLSHNHHQFGFQWFCLLSRWWTISRR